MTTHVSQLIENQKILIHRQFPPHIAARIPVSKNQSLAPVQIVAQYAKEMGYEHIPLANLLDISATDVEDHLMVAIGDQVRMGTVLAERKRRIGRPTRVTSPVGGIVSEVINGSLYIMREPDDVNLRALVKGTLSHVIPGKGVAIQIFGSSFPVAWNNGSEGYGELVILSKSADSELADSDLNIHLYKKVVTIGHLADISLLNRLIDAEVAGLICGTISPNVFQVASSINVPFALTDGVGKGGIFAPIFSILNDNTGHHTALYNRKFNIHNRPLVVIVNSDLEPADAQLPKNYAGIKLTKGQTVRLLVGDKRGIEGVVEKVHAWPQTTLNGSRYMGADVKFGEENAIFVPAVNLDIIL